MSLAKKIKELREKNNYTLEELGELVGLSKQMINHYETGRNEPRPKIIRKLAEIFKVDIDELMSNEIRQNNFEFNKSNVGYSKEKSLGVGLKPTKAYYVPVTAQAGFLQHMENEVYLSQLEEVILPPEYRDVRFIFDVGGDSMYPTFSSGDKLGCLQVRSIEYFRWGEPYIIDIQDGSKPMLKRIEPDEKDDSYIILTSDNFNHKPMRVRKDSINTRYLFHVISIISKNTGTKVSITEKHIQKLTKDIDIIASGILPHPENL